MRIATRRIRAFTAKKMHTRRDSFGCGVVRQVAGVAGRTISRLKVVFAYGDFGRVVDVRAERAFGATS